MKFSCAWDKGLLGGMGQDGLDSVVKQAVVDDRKTKKETGRR